MSELMKIDEVNEENLAKVAAMIGQVDNSRPEVAAGLPRLAIEQQNENKEGDTLPKGSFRLRVGDQTVYSKEIEARFFVRYYSYDLWNQENPEDSIRTVLAPSLSDDFPDTSGGNKCGKLAKDEIANLSTNSLEHAIQKSIKCTQVIYGTVTKAEGAATADGEEVDLKGTPFIWSARGSAFMPVNTYIREVPSNKIMFGQKVKIATKRNVNGSVIYYTPVFDKPQSVKVTDKDIELLNTFMEDISKWNTRVLKQYNERKDTVLAREDLDIAQELESA
jgi:hypothetical protein